MRTSGNTSQEPKGHVSLVFLCLFAALVLSLASIAPGCGGGGDSSHDESMSVTLRWDSPDLNEDGTPLTGLAGYRVYDGCTSGEYTMVTDVGQSTRVTIGSLCAGTYYFAVTAYDFYGNESDFSNETVVTLRRTTPERDSGTPDEDS